MNNGFWGKGRKMKWLKTSYPIKPTTIDPTKHLFPIKKVDLGKTNIPLYRMHPF
jgi:hypothetical protein